MSHKLTIAEFVSASNLKHGNVFGYTKSQYVNAKIKVTITCSIHGDFTQRPGAHMSGAGCPKCNSESKLGKSLYDTEAFLERAGRVHGKLYDYSKTVYLNCATEVKIGCAVHGLFLQTPTAHLSGRACPECLKPRVPIKDTSKFKLEARQIHGNRFKYNQSVYTDFRTPLKILCRQHGAFWTNPCRHIKNQLSGGCPGCTKGAKSSTSSFILEALEVHGTNYDYSQVKYQNANSRVTIICSKHGPFQQFARLHLKGSGCPGCSTKGIRFSNVAISWIELESKKRKLCNVQHALRGGEYRIPGTRFRVDG